MNEFGKDINVPSRKGVFIHDITVEMLRNASLEGVEALLASGEMEDISLPSAQPEFTTINKFIDGLEEIFADIREIHVDDSVCGWCEFDGAYVGESGDWCNECPGFDRDDCFKLRDRIREKRIAEITNIAPSAQTWIPVTERLPEPRRSVIISTKEWTGEGCYWVTTEHHVIWKGYRWNATYWDDEVTAWMPLPEPYREGKR